MYRSKVMERALIGAITSISPRIEEAITRNELWRYQMGDTPLFIGDCTVVDENDPENDSVVVTFAHSPWDLYDYRLRVEFHDVDGLIDVVVFDVNLTNFNMSIFPDYSFGALAIGDIDEGEADKKSFVHYPIEDIGTVLTALAAITDGEMLKAEILKANNVKALEAEARAQRRSQFKVVEGGKKE